MTSGSLVASAEHLAAERGLTTWNALMLVLLSHLNLQELPVDVRPAMRRAREYWATEDGDRARLFEAKLLVWGFLAALPPGQDLVTPAGRMTRALLCVLEPDGEAGACEDTAEWFVDMLRDR